MISAEMVKASVVDIRPPNFPLPSTMAVDANVLYVIGYDFSSLRIAGGGLPSLYQTRDYPAWWKHAAKGKVSFCTTAWILAEVAHVVERAELEIAWRTDAHPLELDPDRPGQDFTPKYVKKLRYHYSDRLQGIRESVVEITLRSIRKQLDYMPRREQEEPEFQRTLDAWRLSAADVTDASLVVRAKQAGVTSILSDDADLISFEGITLYTANRKAIDAAKWARKLKN
jgi:predicted nucleic acid-binding protein